MGSPGFIYGDLELQTLLSHNKQIRALITAPVVFPKAKGRWGLRWGGCCIFMRGVGRKCLFQT